jgi:hypothetical protein
MSVPIGKQSTNADKIRLNHHLAHLRTMKQLTKAYAAACVLLSRLCLPPAIFRVVVPMNRAHFLVDVRVHFDASSVIHITACSVPEGMLRHPAVAS